MSTPADGQMFTLSARTGVDYVLDMFDGRFKFNEDKVDHVPTERDVCKLHDGTELICIGRAASRDATIRDRLPEHLTAEKEY